ncbi:Fer4 21 domain containing protein [Asbolus verrucosus]|uniref:Fer4 21 domain containing protein n=1 Tax=Asbolus verrucosus TaxID=1661398 RepID=A0A482WEQ2_ASBVE|nr:Fer4 21 domain containing protein [Asbolus verrucosus]
MAEDAGADALELNLSCPHGMGESGMGLACGQKLPHFGPYLKEREIQEKQLNLDINLHHNGRENGYPNSDELKNGFNIPKVNNVIGRALPKIGAYKKLDNSKQVVALIDDDMCINCGKCYLACNDSGYQAISFDPETHIPSVTDDCTGCTMCLSVCPIVDCIAMVPKTIPHVIKRGEPIKLVHALDSMQCQ